MWLGGADNPGTWLGALAPLTGPGAGWVYFASAVVGFLWKRKQAIEAGAALKTTVDGLKTAITTGDITVTKDAPAIVNAAVARQLHEPPFEDWC